MLAFLIRRLLMALVTLVGVMLLTFVLFGLTAGDIAAGFLPPKATKQQRMEWLRRNKLHLPLIVNFHRRIVLRDRTEGPNDFTAEDAPGSAAATALGRPASASASSKSVCR
jgi:hypothetical protein